MPDQVS